MKKNSKYKPLISVITPTWNRANTLHRAFNSLESQSYKNFEWIVCDDASSDNTVEILKKWKKKAKFKIRIFSFSKRVGKPFMDNFCINIARGEFIVPVDSDDRYKENSFKKLVNEWQSIPEKDKKKIFGIICRCMDSNGKPLEKKLHLKNNRISLFDLHFKKKKSIEKWIFYKSSILKKFKYPVVDYYVPEGVLLNNISLKYDLWVLDKALRVFYKDTKNSVSHSSKIQNMNGQHYAILHTINISKKINLSNEMTSFWSYINLIRYSLHCKKKLFSNFLLVNGSEQKIKVLLSIPFGLTIFFRDLLTKNINFNKFIIKKNKPREIK